MAWTKTRDSDGRTYIETKPAAGGPVTIEDFVEFPFIFDLRIDGRTLVYPLPDFSGGRGQVTVLKPDGDGPHDQAPRGPERAATSDVRGDEVVFATISDNRSRRSGSSPTTWPPDKQRSSAGSRTPTRMAIDDLNDHPDHIVFSLDKHLRTARTGFVVMNRDGSNRHWLIKDT